MHERRRAARHALEARVQLDRGPGLTRDISGVGVLFETPVELEAGEEIEFTVAIPDAADVRCRGRVVRVSATNSDRHLVAATIEGYAVEGTATDPSHAVLRDLSMHQPQGWEWGE